MRLLRARVAPVAVSLGAGLLLGLAGPVAGKWENSFCVAMSTVFSAGWSWAGYAFMVGYFRRSKIESALLSSLGLTIGVVAYYLFKDASPAIPTGTEPVSDPAGIESDISEDGHRSQILVWGVAALIFGAPVGLLGNLARISGIGGLCFRLIVPLVALFETSMRISAEAGRQGLTVDMTWHVVRIVAGAVALALVGYTIWSWWHAQRTRTYSGNGVRT